MMKKILAILALCPALAWAWPYGSGGGVDYSRDAAHEFYCANLAGSPVTTQAGLSKTSPALVLANPSGSNKLVTLLDVGIDVTASPASAAGFMLAYSTGDPNAITVFSTNTYTLPANVVNVVPSTTTQAGYSSAKCYGGGGTVLPNTPVAFRYLGGTTGASAIGGVLLTDQTNGKVVLPPGATISIQSTSAAAIISDFIWREDAL